MVQEKVPLYKSVRSTSIDGNNIDFGMYINADDIASALLLNKFSFYKYKVKTGKSEIVAFADRSGLLADDFTQELL